MTIEIPEIITPGSLISPLYELDELNGKIIKEFIPGYGCKIVKLQTKDGEHGEIPVIVGTILGKVILEEMIEEESKLNENDLGIIKKETNLKKLNNLKKSPIKIPIFQINVYNNNISVYEKNLKTNSLQNKKFHKSSLLPEVLDIVLAKVTKITLQKAHVEILIIEGQGTVSYDSGIGVTGSNSSNGIPTSSNNNNTGGTSSGLLGVSDIGESFKGIIRSQDVRSTNRDQVQIADSFKPGDIVRAIVISLGDGTNYYLSTARNDLGVVFARASTRNSSGKGSCGELLYPIDWKSMVCGTTGVVENRKVAKPFTNK